MVDIEKLSGEAVKGFVQGLLEPLSIRVQARENRKNQKADIEAYRELIAINPSIERFDGLATIIDSSLQDATEEQRRLANNIVRTGIKALSVIEQNDAVLAGC